MTVIIPSPNYREGRIKPVRLVVLHTAETPCEPGRARSIATFLANPARQASCHWVVDPTETVGQVDEADTAWAAPGGNADGIQIEQAAYAGFGPGDWAAGPAQQMLGGQLVPLVAGICARWSIPPVPLDTAQVAAGAAGITTHVAVSEAFGLSDHWDCGPDFPLAVVCDLVAETLNPPTEESAMSLTVITPQQRPVMFNGRSVADLWLAPSGVRGRTTVESTVVVMPVDPFDAVDPAKPLRVDIHQGGVSVQTVTVPAAGVAVPITVGGRIGVVYDEARPVHIEGREAHFS